MSDLHPILLDRELVGAQLATANQMLRYHGVPEVGPCKVAHLLESVSGMELGRAAHILRELTTALEEGPEKGGQV